MKLDLSELLANVGMHLTYPVDEPPIREEDLQCSQPVKGTLTFTNAGNALVLRGSVQSVVSLTCSRCLALYEEPVDSTIEEVFTLQTGAHAGRRRNTLVVMDDDENPDAGILFTGPIFDLTEFLRQSIGIELPVKPLHDEYCKGLCPQCGQDLNLKQCGCKAEKAPTGFSALAALLPDGQPSHN